MAKSADRASAPLVVTEVSALASTTEPSGLRNVMRNGVLLMSTRKPSLDTARISPSVTFMAGRGQERTTVKEAFVENGTSLLAIRTRATDVSSISSFTTAVWQVKVSSLRSLLNQETRLPGSARPMAGRLSNRIPHPRITIRFMEASFLGSSQKSKARLDKSSRRMRYLLRMGMELQIRPYERRDRAGL